MKCIDFNDFVQNVGIMKPKGITEDNLKHQAKLDLIIDGNEYVAEEKIDGCRFKLFGCRMFSKDNNEKTDNMPHIRDFFAKLGMPNLIIDGEAHYPGKTSQYATRVTGADASTAIAFQDANGYIHYTIWDILRLPNGVWTISNNYKERRKVVEYFYLNYIKGTPMEEYIHVIRNNYDDKRNFIKSLLGVGLEGAVLKKINGIYQMGKQPMWEWVKVKQSDEADLFIIGYDPAKVEYTGKNFDSWEYWQDVNGIRTPVTKYHYNNWIGALVLGAYVDGEVKRICSASGFSESLRKNISENQDAYMGRVVRVGYMERTSAGYPRHPKFKNFHEDKQAHECTWEFTQDELNHK